MWHPSSFRSQRRQLMPRAGLDPARVTAIAVEITESDGLDALSLARVAAVAGVASPSLYKHIVSLDSLQVRVRAHATAHFAEALGTATADRSGAEALENAASAYRAFAQQHPRLYPLTQAPIDDADWQAAATRSIDAMQSVTRGYDIPAELHIDALRLIRSGLHGFVDLEARGGFGLPDSLDDTFGRLVGALDAALRALGEAPAPVAAPLRGRSDARP